MSTQVEDFPSGAAGKESACNAGAAADWGLIPGSERSPGGGNNNPLQYSCPEKSYGTEGAWGLQSVGSQSQTRLSMLNNNTGREVNSLAQGYTSKW